MKYRFALACLAALSIPTYGQAQLGDVSCDDSARLTATLKTVFGAERHGIGLRDPETTLEIWVAQRSGDWIIVQSYANGTSCIVAMGEHWEGNRPGPA